MYDITVNSAYNELLGTMKINLGNELSFQNLCCPQSVQVNELQMYDFYTKLGFKKRCSLILGKKSQINFFYISIDKIRTQRLFNAIKVILTLSMNSHLACGID